LLNQIKSNHAMRPGMGGGDDCESSAMHRFLGSLKKSRLALARTSTETDAIHQQHQQHKGRHTR